MTTYLNIIQPTDNGDMTISQLTPTVNDGSNTKLYASLVGAGDINRAVMRFSFSGFISPEKLTASQINSATITLTSAEAGAISFGFCYRILSTNSQWDEFTGTYNLQNGVLPWGGGAGLATAGLDYSTTVLGAWAATSVAVGSERTITINSAAELVEMVKNNYGIVFIASSEVSENAISLCASSNNIEAYRPKITIDYSPATSIAADSSVNAYHGTISSGVTSAGVNGMQFNGADYIDIYDVGMDALFASRRTFIIQAKSDYLQVNPTPRASGRATMYNTGEAVNYARGLQFTTTGGAVVSIGGYTIQRAVTQTMTTKAVYALTVEDSAGNSSMYNYIDGVNTASSPSNPFGAWDGTLSSTKVCIGALDTAGEEGWYGTLQNYIIGYIAAASDTDIATISSALTAGTLTGATLDTILGAGKWSWWKLDEAIPSVATVQLGKARTIEITGADSVKLGKDKDIVT